VLRCPVRVATHASVRPFASDNVTKVPRRSELRRSCACHRLATVGMCVAVTSCHEDYRDGIPRSPFSAYSSSGHDAESNDDRQLAMDLRLARLRTQVAVVRALADQIELLVRPQHVDAMLDWNPERDSTSSSAKRWRASDADSSKWQQSSQSRQLPKTAVSSSDRSGPMSPAIERRDTEEPWPRPQRPQAKDIACPKLR
jgi:hypothetical protein